MSSETSNPPIELIGVISGITACLIFLVFHQLTISNIWFSSPFMLGISALAGVLLIRSYRVLFGDYRLKTWLLYNTYFILSLTLLSFVSVILFSPRYTSEEILNSGGPPPEGLITSGLPLTLSWMLTSAVVIIFIAKRSFKGFTTVLGTSGILFLTLGLNLSILGFVDILPQHEYLVEKFILMNVMLGALFTFSFSIIRSYLN